MEDKFKENYNDDEHIVITQEDIKKSSRNPFRADALKALFGVVVGTVGIGLICRFTNLDDLSYFKGLSLFVEGNLAMNLVKNVKNYFGYRSYRKGIDHDVSKDFYLNERRRINEMYVREVEKKR